MQLKFWKTKFCGHHCSYCCEPELPRYNTALLSSPYKLSFSSAQYRTALLKLDPSMPNPLPPCLSTGSEAVSIPTTTMPSKARPTQQASSEASIQVGPQLVNALVDAFPALANFSMPARLDLFSGEHHEDPEAWLSEFQHLANASRWTNDMKCIQFKNTYPA